VFAVIRLVRMSSLALVAGLLAITAASASAESRHHSSKTDLSVQRSLRSGAAKVRVIITVENPAERQSVRQALESHGDTIKSEHPFVGALAAEVHASDVAQLANYPGVQFVSADATVSAGAADYSSTSSTSGSTWPGDTTSQTSTANNLRATLGLAPVASTGPTGRGIGVALIDSGISPNLDFGFRITGFYYFTKGGVPAAAYDDYGHGTHVAGLIGSNGLL